MSRVQGQQEGFLGGREVPEGFLEEGARPYLSRLGQGVHALGASGRTKSM